MALEAGTFFSAGLPHSLFHSTIELSSLRGWSVSSLWEVSAPLLLACVLGAVVGLERELHGRPAGLRTHILLSMGAALFGMVSVSMKGASGDPTRIAAQVVTGIGFIGAGTIIHLGGTVRGLTTAASIWATSAIGLAVGLDRRFWMMAVVATVIAFLTLTLVNLLEDFLRLKRRVREMEVVVREDQAVLDSLLHTLAAMRVEVQSIRTLPSLLPDTRRYELLLNLPPRLSARQVLGRVAQCQQVIEVKWD
jgi:putative Mg2+ transporter-C (MgtC) family protein